MIPRRIGIRRFQVTKYLKKVIGKHFNPSLRTRLSEVYLESKIPLRMHTL